MRVAVLSADQETFLGFGEYEGDFDCPKLREFFAGAADAMGYPDLAERLRSGEIPQTSPRIRLDNGKTIWGCECWWGDEEKFRNSKWAEKVGTA